MTKSTVTNAELESLKTSAMMAQVAEFDKGKLIAVEPSTLESILVELLAVREAQPVVEVKPYGYLRENNGQVQISIGPIRPADRASGYATPWGAIYAAPPAPAVPEDITGIIKRFQYQCDHLSNWHHIDEHSCKVDRRDLMTVTEFLNACRAAMRC